MIDMFRVVRPIGHGTYGRVYLVQDEHNAFLAVKSIELEGPEQWLLQLRQNFDHEVGVL